jgi:hypothetical protein
MEYRRGHFQGHQSSVRGERDMPGIRGVVSWQSSNQPLSFDVPETELVAPRDDQRSAVRGEEYPRPLSYMPFVDHLPGVDIPELDEVRVPAATRRPPAIRA